MPDKKVPTKQASSKSLLPPKHGCLILLPSKLGCLIFACLILVAGLFLFQAIEFRKPSPNHIAMAVLKNARTLTQSIYKEDENATITRSALVKNGLIIYEGVHFEVLNGERGSVAFRANHEKSDIQYDYKVVSADKWTITETKIEKSSFKKLWRSIFPS